MNDAEFEQQKARVEKLIEKWRDLLWLNGWHFKHSFERQERKEDRDRGYSVSADVLPQWEYLHADFKWYLPIVALLADDELERYVIHEFTHVIVAEMAKGKKDPHEERVCTHLALALYEIAKEKGDATQEGQQPKGDQQQHSGTEASRPFAETGDSDSL